MALAGSKVKTDTAKVPSSQYIIGQVRDAPGKRDDRGCRHTRQLRRQQWHGKCCGELLLLLLLLLLPAYVPLLLRRCYRCELGLGCAQRGTQPRAAW